MRVVVTGSARGMGLATVKKFLAEGHEVFGVDIAPAPSEILNNPSYTHYIANVVYYDQLPEILDVNVLINNAGAQGSGVDIDVNLKGVMNTTRKYALDNKQIRSVLNQASASAHLGNEYDEYVASKGGVVSYTKWVAKEIAPYGATCNSLSFAGVETELNKPVMDDPILWEQVMRITPLRRWATLTEVADWVYFMTMINRSCSGQDIMIDNLESLNGVFVWE